MQYQPKREHFKRGDKVQIRNKTGGILTFGRITLIDGKHVCVNDSEDKPYVFVRSMVQILRG